jgi:hypothetical protein
MDYKQEYLNYKNKYLGLKNKQIGGMIGLNKMNLKNNFNSINLKNILPDLKLSDNKLLQINTEVNDKELIDVQMVLYKTILNNNDLNKLKECVEKYKNKQIIRQDQDDKINIYTYVLELIIRYKLSIFQEIFNLYKENINDDRAIYLISQIILNDDKSSIANINNDINSYINYDIDNYVAEKIDINSLEKNITEHEQKYNYLNNIQYIIQHIQEKSKTNNIINDDIINQVIMLAISFKNINVVKDLVNKNINNKINLDLIISYTKEEINQNIDNNIFNEILRFLQNQETVKEIISNNQVFKNVGFNLF